MNWVQPNFHNSWFHLKTEDIYFALNTFFYHFLACTVTSRHLLLRNSLGTMKIEEDALFTIWLTLGLVTMFFIIGPTLSCYLFKWTNSSLHLSFDIVADEVEKEKAEKKKCCCWNRQNTYKLCFIQIFIIYVHNTKLISSTINKKI